MFQHVLRRAGMKVAAPGDQMPSFLKSAMTSAIFTTAASPSTIGTSSMRVTPARTIASLR